MSGNLSLYRRQLLHVLQAMGPENIWRPVSDEKGRLLADGHEDMRDTGPGDLASFDFRGKSVLDLGCNLGYYSFLARKSGAATVWGLDIDPLAVKGCILLSKIYQMDDIHFSCTDFCGFTGDTSFDVIFLINFIGKKSLVKGIQPALDICRRYGKQAVIISVRCRYHIRHSLRVDPGLMREKYGAKYVRGEWFETILFLQDYLDADFCQLSPDYDDSTLKRTLLLRPVTE